MNFTPTVSIVMCTYNGAMFLEEQLQSLVQQTYPIQELLVFDDASVDGTPAILKRFADEYNFIQLHINPKNIGFNKNFEQALKAANGDLIAICDQDDIWVDTKIEKMVKGWKPKCPLIYCGALSFVNEVPQQYSLHPLYRQFEGTDARKIFLRNTVSGHALLIKKSFLPLVLPFIEDVMYDWMMAVTAACNGGVQFYPEVLVFQREHRNNATLQSGKQQTIAQQRIAFKKQRIEHLQAFIKIPGMPSQHALFAEKLATLLTNSMKHNFYFHLFSFLLKHRNILFNYKKRKIGFISHIKHSYLSTRNV
ncbi:MAG: glycosyltransferase [Chitinophagaceae bacterium]|nr:glycosyltransferase [Chitinophagaceae bacterium]